MPHGRKTTRTEILRQAKILKQNLVRCEVCLKKIDELAQSRSKVIDDHLAYLEFGFDTLQKICNQWTEKL